MNHDNTSTTRIYDIYGIGNALVDTEIEVSDADLRTFDIDKGVMTLVDAKRQTHLVNLLEAHLVTSKRASGGSGANSVIAASYFGASTFYVCKVADDDNGRFYLADLKAAGVNYRNTNGEDIGITGKCLVMITPDAERTMNSFLGISESLSPQDIDEVALQQSRYTYIEGYLVTSPTGHAAALKVKQLAQQFQVKTAISLSDPAIVEHFTAGLKAIVGDGVDILFCNEAEAIKFTQTQSFEQASEQLKQWAKTFAITRGAQGALVYDGNQTYNIDAHQVQALDSNGAGDMFAGAFLYAISQGHNYRAAGEFASKASSIVVSQFGPRLRADQHREILDFLK